MIFKQNTLPLKAWFLAATVTTLAGCNLSPTKTESAHTEQPTKTDINGFAEAGDATVIAVEAQLDNTDSIKTAEASTDKETTNATIDNAQLETSATVEDAADADSLIVYVPGEQPKADLWERIRQGYSLDHADHSQRIDTFIKRQSRFPNHVLRVSKRAEPYLHHIVNELEKRDMPLELALLPIVESQFDAFAYSPGRASGLWQFIPGTGRRFKLEQNWWYDGRRDVVAATEAALSYLQYLNRFFDGDWLLALAAYNAGEGTVARAIKRNKRKGKPTDYWSLKLPKETRLYIPKLLAWAEIIQSPAQYAVELTPIADKPYFASVDIGSQIDLAEAAKMAGIDIKTLYRLNPAYNRWATDPKAPHHLLVPVANAEQLKQALADKPVSERVTWQRYTIKSGDSLGLIAEKFGTRVSVLKTANKLKDHRIRAGRTLIIPSASMPSDYYSHSAKQRLNKRQSQSPRGRERTVYRVKAGDSLWLIAKRHSVNVSALARWNGIAPRDTLKLGQKLVIWKTPNKNKQANNSQDSRLRKLHYSVRQGDSLAYIAGKFSVRIKDIERWNNLNRQRYLQPGQQLRLYVDVNETSVN